LTVEKQNADEIVFAPVSLSTLVDSPVLAGQNFRSITLAPDVQPPHRLNLAADSTAATARSLRKLVPDRERKKLRHDVSTRAMPIPALPPEIVVHRGKNSANACPGRGPQETKLMANGRSLTSSSRPEATGNHH
jgi:hypothetical protein